MRYATWRLIIPGVDLLIADEGALGLQGSCADIADDLLAGIGEAMEVALVDGGLDAEDGADVFGIVLQDRPPGEGSFGNGVLADINAIEDVELLGIQGDEYQWGPGDDVAGQGGGSAEDNIGVVVGLPASVG